MNSITAAVVQAQTFPIVDKLSSMAEDTMTTIAMSLIVAIGIVIAVGLIWSHVADRETGKWWKGLAVWAIGSGIILGIGGVTSWIQTNITV